MKRNFWFSFLLLTAGILNTHAQDTLKVRMSQMDTSVIRDSLKSLDSMDGTQQKTDFEISHQSGDQNVDKSKTTKQFMIFPSMVTTSLSMVAPLHQSGAYTIEDASGRVYYNGWLGPGLVTPISVARLKSGMYYVRFDGDGYSETRTFMKL